MNFLKTIINDKQFLFVYISLHIMISVTWFSLYKFTDHDPVISYGMMILIRLIADIAYWNGKESAISAFTLLSIFYWLLVLVF